MRSDTPKISWWGNIVLILSLASLGFYFFGPLGGVGGFMLGVIIILGGPGGL